jgi:hypothetical protein
MSINHMVERESVAQMHIERARFDQLLINGRLELESCARTLF